MQTKHPIIGLITLAYINDEERSALRNLISPAIICLDDEDRDVAEWSQQLIDSVEDLLWARMKLAQAMEAS